MAFNGERRQDIGLKMVYVILTAIITLLLTMFFNKTYQLAESASILSFENKKDVAVIQECISNVKDSLIKIVIEWIGINNTGASSCGNIRVTGTEDRGRSGEYSFGIYNCVIKVGDEDDH